MVELTSDIQAGAVSLLLILYLYLGRRRKNVELPLPPGPKKLPIIGNLLDMPTSLEWETYHKWCKESGSDIIHIDIAGTSIVVLDSAEAATDLLEKRSSMYSGRARMPMMNELMGWNFHFAFMAYGDYWRQHRRLMHQSFHPTAALRFQPFETKATHGLLRRLLNEPDNLIGHLRHMAGETIMPIAYGLDVKEKDDPYIATAERGTFPLVAAAVPGTFLVDSIPALKYVPAWIPFAGFKRKARVWRELAMTMINMPFEAAKSKISSGNYMPSFTSHSLENMDEEGDLAHQEYVIKSTAGSMYAAGSDTTVTAVASCILGLLGNPEAVQKAQEEIDRVVGPEQLPTFADEAALPYVTAIVKEALRWRDVAPIAVPHLVHVEDEYRGYRIPADSIIVANAWAMLHNEKVYPEPFKFNPDRFINPHDGTLNPDVKDPSHAAFGFGRRVCPGRYMAFSAVWIAVASLISVFDITKAVDKKTGQVIEPRHETLPGLVAMPLPFEYSMKPRSQQAVALIRATVNEEYFS